MALPRRPTPTPTSRFTSSPRPPFRLALSLPCPAASAAYTAGALDFMLHALQCWEAAKRRPTPSSSVPQWTVRLTDVAGSSFGGLVAAVFCAAVHFHHEALPSAAHSAAGAGGGALCVPVEGKRESEREAPTSWRQKAKKRKKRRSDAQLEETPERMTNTTPAVAAAEVPTNNALYHAWVSCFSPALLLRKSAHFPPSNPAASFFAPLQKLAAPLSPHGSPARLSSFSSSSSSSSSISSSALSASSASPLRSTALCSSRLRDLMRRRSSAVRCAACGRARKDAPQRRSRSLTPSRLRERSQSRSHSSRVMRAGKGRNGPAAASSSAAAAAVCSRCCGRGNEQGGNHGAERGGGREEAEEEDPILLHQGGDEASGGMPFDTAANVNLFSTTFVHDLLSAALPEGPPAPRPRWLDPLLSLTLTAFNPPATVDAANARPSPPLPPSYPRAESPPAQQSSDPMQVPSSPVTPPARCRHEPRNNFGSQLSRDLEGEEDIVSGRIDVTTRDPARTTAAVSCAEEEAREETCFARPSDFVRLHFPAPARGFDWHARNAMMLALPRDSIAIRPGWHEWMPLLAAARATAAYPTTLPTPPAAELGLSRNCPDSSSVGDYYRDGNVSISNGSGNAHSTRNRLDVGEQERAYDSRNGRLSEYFYDKYSVQNRSSVNQQLFRDAFVDDVETWSSLALSEEPHVRLTASALLDELEERLSNRGAKEARGVCGAIVQIAGTRDMSANDASFFDGFSAVGGNDFATCSENSLSAIGPLRVLKDGFCRNGGVLVDLRDESEGTASVNGHFRGSRAQLSTIGTHSSSQSFRSVNNGGPYHEEMGANSCEEHLNMDSQSRYEQRKYWDDGNLESNVPKKNLFSGSAPNAQSQATSSPILGVSRFALDPRSGELACGAVGQFGGLLGDAVREHDFLLGRYQCQQFLRETLVLDRDTARAHPAFRGLLPPPSRNSSVMRQTTEKHCSLHDVYSNTDERPLDEFVAQQDDVIQLIPLVGDAAVPLQEPEWPVLRRAERRRVVADVGKLVERRVSAALRSAARSESELLVESGLGGESAVRRCRSAFKRTTTRWRLLRACRRHVREVLTDGAAAFRVRR